MVCEKVGGFEFDFRKDPIPFEIENGWMSSSKIANPRFGLSSFLKFLMFRLSANALS